MTIQHHGIGQNAPRLLGVSRPHRLRPQLRNTQILACNLDCRHRVTFAAVWESPRSQVLGWLVSHVEPVWPHHVDCRHFLTVQAR
jgi:hypothetical protein